MAQRNPYLILGVDFAASHDEARHAFARAARRIRRKGGPWEIEDLNWALHEVEALASNPEDMVSIYRVPADREVFEPAGEGLFQPPAVPLERRTDADDARALDAVRLNAMHELDEFLLAACGQLVTVPGPGYAFAGGV